VRVPVDVGLAQFKQERLEFGRRLLQDALVLTHAMQQIIFEQNRLVRELFDGLVYLVLYKVTRYFNIFKHYFTI